MNNDTPILEPLLPDNLLQEPSPVCAQFPVLNINKQFQLREHNQRDIKPFFEYYTNDDVGRYVLATKPKNVKEAKEEVDFCRNLFYQGSGIFWTLARRSDDRMIGCVGLYIKSRHPEPELCFELDKRYWGQGIMSSAIQRVLRFATTSLKLPRIDALTHPENEASMRLLKRNNFSYQQLLPGAKFYKNSWHDVEQYIYTA